MKFDSNNNLISDDCEHVWRVQDGRPILYPGMEEALDHGDHLSNSISPKALDLIKNTEGLVLNLSAGGTPDHWPHVIEAETALFRNTDVVADAHFLPFKDGVFSVVLALNAFEHFRDPFKAASEIHRVLKPGGVVFIHTAFMQPLHEPPWHFYNATKYGILEWFSDFDTDSLVVSDNFNPVYAISWMAKCIDDVLGQALPTIEADLIRNTPLKTFADFWRNPALRNGSTWQAFFRIPRELQEGVAAGFEFIGRRR